jgi:hypothetical protein
MVLEVLSKLEECNHRRTGGAAIICYRFRFNAVRIAESARGFINV